jgi:beta-glucosidase/6-phospho-beta-glucosidase/beta-galactosidase
MLTRKDFGADFKWWVTIRAFQNEGAADADDKGASVWDVFTAGGKNVNDKQAPGNTADFFIIMKRILPWRGNWGLMCFGFLCRGRVLYQMDRVQ